MTPPFPTTLAELAPWRVFADQLTERGDRLGPYLAYELSLGADPTKPQLATFQKKSLRICRVPTLFTAGWMLGHVRTLSLASKAVIDGSELPPLRDLFATPALVNLEQLSVAARAESIGRRWHEAMRRLPRSCRRVELHASRFSADDAKKVIDGLPAQVEVLRLVPRYGTDPASFLSDRFAWVDLRPIIVTPESAESLAEALASTSRVRLRLGTVSHRSVLTRLADRAVVGDVDDAALVAEDGAISLFERTSLEALQERSGVVTAQAQLERSLKESFRLGRRERGLGEAAAWHGDAVISREAGTWWIRAVGAAERGASVRLEGAPLAAKAVALVEGARVSIEGRAWRFQRMVSPHPDPLPRGGEGEQVTTGRVV